DRSPRVLFMCYGNICRSPFAALYAQHQAEQLGIDGIEFLSAGTYPKQGRSSPPEAVRAASDFGIDLSPHRSCIADDHLINSAGMIVCMDFKNYDELHRAWPDAADRIFLLGSFDGRSNHPVIADPWGGPASEFRRCYARIADCIDTFTRRLVLRSDHIR